jgi:hypothetical protein
VRVNLAIHTLIQQRLKILGVKNFQLLLACSCALALKRNYQHTIFRLRLTQLGAQHCCTPTKN